MRPLHRVLLVPLVLLAVVLTACGVEPQDRPEAIAVPAEPSSSGGTAPGTGGVEVTVYFVRGTRLDTVERRAPDDSAASALELVAAGPSRAEVLSGLRTALGPQLVSVDDPGLAGGTAELILSPEFAGVSGGNQLLAVAQVVFTVTERPGVTQVHFSSAGAPVEVPTDAGLTDAPVGRADYRSVTPQRPSPAATSTAPPATSSSGPP